MGEKKTVLGPFRIEASADPAGEWVIASLVLDGGGKAVEVSRVRATLAELAPEAYRLWQEMLSEVLTSAARHSGFKVVRTELTPLDN